MAAGAVRLLLLAAWILWIGAAGGEEIRGCPNRCICFRTTVRCMFLRLERVPPVPLGTTILDLRFNRITELLPGEFEELSHLHTLLLNNNHISTIYNGAFRGLKNLRYLYLYKNRIREINSKVFQGLYRLEQLYLHYNAIEKLAPGVFSGLRRLERLFLHNNKLQRIPPGTFKNLDTLKRLRLDSNALICDCQLMWLAKMLKESAATTQAAAHCHSPPSMRGKPLVMATEEDFHCRKPTILQGPNDIEVSFGGTAYFTCKAEGDPEPDIVWMRNSNELSLADPRYSALTDGTLMIENAALEDVGVYECMAKSAAGEVKSRSARMKYIQPKDIAPSWIESPKNVTVVVGETAKFHCTAEGRPIPAISWFFEGRPINAGGRVEISDNGSILRVTDATTYDIGKYMCRAANSAGHKEETAYLTVLQGGSAPTLLYTPYDMEVHAGSTVEMPCYPEGEPEPTILWTVDGRQSPADRRHRMSGSGSYYIYNVSASDAGVYQCSATNAYGTVHASGILSVQGNLAGHPGDRYVQAALEEARHSVDKAVNDTLNMLRGAREGGHPRAPSPGDLLRLFRYPGPVERDLARAAEIYERTLANVRRHVAAGLKLDQPDEFSYEDLLSPSQLDVVARLSGCMAHRPSINCTNMCFHGKYRTADGTCNNLIHPMWGASLIGFRRLLKPAYENGFNLPIGWTKSIKYFGHHKPSTRLVSTQLISTKEVTPDSHYTHMLMQWGQFLDHDIDHAIPSLSGESFEEGVDCKKSCEYASPCYPIEIPPNDPRVKHRRCIDFIRSSAVCGSGHTSVLFDKVLPREQINQLTSYIDASQVYGFTEDLAEDLRDFKDEWGLLRTGVTSRSGGKPLLPFAGNQPIDCRRDPQESNIGCFLAGDIRANEQVALLAMHTLWLREHNRLAAGLRQLNPSWDGETIYQEARKIVGATMQHITYSHWLPHIVGPSGMEMLGSYAGYDPTVEATISNAFATAALRFGHSLINPVLQRLDNNLRPIPEGPLPLHKAFFSPWRLVEEGGVDPLMRGMFSIPAKLKTPHQTLNSELTERLFEVAHEVALDLAAINIQRGRDHGLPGYNEYREFCNLSPARTFDELHNEIRNIKLREKLKHLYGHPGNVDVWVGGILEDPVPGGKVGPLFQCLLVEQFRRLRNGDRFWYENPAVFKPEQLLQIKQSSLARVICDNGDNITEVNKDVFILPKHHNPHFVQCPSLPEIDLRFWTECCDGCVDGKYKSFGQTVVGRQRRAAEYSFPSDKPKQNAHVIHSALHSNMTGNGIGEGDGMMEKAVVSMDVNGERIEGLESMLEGIRKEMKQLKRKIRKIEVQCKAEILAATKICVEDNGGIRKHGQSWITNNCTRCSCKDSNIECSREDCHAPLRGSLVHREETKEHWQP
ncbi:peroxidasin homolog [Hetaerina americana]|uniref:peroxidasin homolog n=1 Tax=Hetaerina americana TaxID=62018 RepID=UPI003A7F4D2B